MNIASATLPVYGPLNIERFWQKLAGWIGVVLIGYVGVQIVRATESVITLLVTLVFAVLFGVVTSLVGNIRWDSKPVRAWRFIVGYLLSLAVLCVVLSHIPQYVGVKADPGTFFEVNGVPHLLVDKVYPDPLIHTVTVRRLGGDFETVENISSSRKANFYTTYAIERSGAGIALAKRYDDETIESLVREISTESISSFVESHPDDEYLDDVLNCFRCNFVAADELLRSHVKDIPEGLTYTITMTYILKR